MEATIKSIIEIVIKYFYEIFKYWNIIPEEVAEKIEEEASNADAE